jgi:hypothetical protein
MDNINQDIRNQNQIKEESKEEIISEPIVDINEHQNTNQDQIRLNPEYYDEFNRPNYEQIIAYENQLRADIESSSPLISDKMDITFLVAEFKDSIFEGSIQVNINNPGIIIKIQIY